MRYLPRTLIIIATLLPTTLQAEQSSGCQDRSMSMDKVIACELALLNEYAYQSSKVRAPFTFRVNAKDISNAENLCATLNYQETFTSDLDDKTLSVICYNSQ